MQLRVLGSSAGGGFPQWNCNCPQCDGVRQGRVRATPRTQSSVAVSADGRDWLLINASPDILTQIRATAQLQPARALRDSGIAAVLLMDAQIDHTAGLLMLRERRSPLPLLATREVLAELEDSLPLTRVLSHYCGVAPHVLPLDGSRFSVPGLPGVVVQALALSSSPPPYSPHRSAPRPGDNIGVLLHNPATGARIFYAPAWARSRLNCWSCWPAAAPCWSMAPSGAPTKCSAWAWARAARPTWATCRKAARAECSNTWRACPPACARC